MDLVDHQQRAEVQRQKIFFLWALDENVTTESWKKRERCFFKSKIRACGGGGFGRADMIQRGQRDVRYFLKKWTFNDRLGDSVRLTAEDEEGRRCSDYTKKVKISALMQLTAQHHFLQLPPLLPPPGQEISNSTLRASTISVWLHHRTGERLM